MIQRRPFLHSATAGDVARLEKLLRDALAGTGFSRSGRLAVLNAACGRADETGALAAALGPAEIGFYLGIDLRPDAIADAARRWELPGGAIAFRTGDAAEIATMKHLPPFDLIFIRHQNYWDDPARWDRLLEILLNALAPGGLLACTSYFDREHHLARTALLTRGAEILRDVPHPATRPLPEAPGKSVDRHLALFRRPDRGGGLHPPGPILSTRDPAFPSPASVLPSRRLHT